MLDVRVEIDHGALDELLTGPEMAAHLTRVAERGGAIARRTQRGANRKGAIVVTPARREGRTLRASFGSTSSFWHLEEFGSLNNAPYRTLTNAALALGIDFTAT